jgi:hypothetical protein
MVQHSQCQCVTIYLWHVLSAELICTTTDFKQVCVNRWELYLIILEWIIYRTSPHDIVLVIVRLVFLWDTDLYDSFISVCILSVGRWDRSSTASIGSLGLKPAYPGHGRSLWMENKPICTGKILGSITKSFLNNWKSTSLVCNVVKWHDIERFVYNLRTNMIRRILPVFQHQ